MEIIAHGTVTTPAGFTAAATACGLKESGKPDLALVASTKNCAAAGVFTKNRVAAAPVLLDRETLATNKQRIRAVVTNAGNANACTGEPGIHAAQEMQNLTAKAIGCAPEQVFVMSTGVIGVQLPMEKVRAGIMDSAEKLSDEGGLDAAGAIITTDLQPKHLAIRVELPDGTVTIAGMAKGSGMIHPNMATMLGIITTDAIIAADTLQELLTAATNLSFNRISVDGDTSTNDTVLALANGASGVEVTGVEATASFGQALDTLCIELAKMIVRDGEGAKKFVELLVTGARSEEDAFAVARTIATSPLVKTAFAGGDPNWGRILAAAGRSGVPLQQEKLALWVSAKQSVQLVQDGTPLKFDEDDAASVFAQSEFKVHVELGMGNCNATMWTCDLTHDYVTINADYRT